MSLILSMNHSLLISPEASALQEEDAGKFYLKFLFVINIEAEEEDS